MLFKICQSRSLAKTRSWSRLRRSPSTQPIGNVRCFLRNCNRTFIKPLSSRRTDTKWWTKPGTCIGCDFAGEVVQVGPNLKTNIKVGDKVASTTRGGISSERGAFTEYAKTFADLVFVIPEGTWSIEEASTIGIPFVTNQLFATRGY